MPKDRVTNDANGVRPSSLVVGYKLVTVYQPQTDKSIFALDIEQAVG
jgi:hypothetical protein